MYHMHMHIDRVSIFVWQIKGCSPRSKLYCWILKQRSPFILETKKKNLQKTWLYKMGI
uniref:Uncharacterized protein n=1 Tax=Rhizophora mucronata TaxID=61149 RepID=A0A2P2NV71_RHIMU